MPNFTDEQLVEAQVLLPPGAAMLIEDVQEARAENLALKAGIAKTIAWLDDRIRSGNAYLTDPKSPTGRLDNVLAKVETYEKVRDYLESANNSLCTK